MARGKAINVKIATPKVITALTNKLAELEANYKKQDENEAKYQELHDAWKKELFYVFHSERLEPSQCFHGGHR